MNKAQKLWVLVTGALGGIGQALVKEFIANDYNVIAADLKDYHGEFDSLEGVKFVNMDLALIAEDEAYTNQFVRDIERYTLGAGVSALVNNAAVQILEPFSNISRESWQASFNVNLTAPLFLAQSLYEQLANNGGAIVNISSIHASQTKREFVTYATSKAAMSSLTRNLAVDVGGKVRVNAIEPAAVGTDMLLAGFKEKKKSLKPWVIFILQDVLQRLEK